RNPTKLSTRSTPRFRAHNKEWGSTGQGRVKFISQRPVQVAGRFLLGGRVYSFWGRGACCFVFVHPLEHTQTDNSRGLPKRSGKDFGTCFCEQHRQVGQRTAPSSPMTPSSSSKTHCGGKLR